ncbi:cytochrome b5 domain-containing protein [Candidatus Micrarchaeota archaeon]|nr:cytochrome b5 domain-containing protein [Candidatus Micrarchaeota archaeon]MBU2476382.1 cytochrome b5 domain-containing protein [Candidatus Micrarchaeota archaeon]
MDKKNLFLGLLALVLVFGCTQAEPAKNNKVNNSDNSVPETKTFSLSEVAEHNSKQDCWLVLSGKVYDVTDFIGSHPGGAAILEGCGKDATELFETRPIGSGTPHSETARTLRENYFIGNLE